MIGGGGAGEDKEAFRINGPGGRISRSLEETSESPAGAAASTQAFDLNAHDSYAPCAGVAMRRFIRDFLPALASVSHFAIG